MIINKTPKTKLYKRPWFLLVAGMIIGPIIIFLVFLAYTNREQIGSLPLIRDTRNATIVATKKSVSIKNCVADPSSIQLSLADYSTEERNLQDRAPSIALINLDSQKHKIAMNGITGELTVPANGTIDISFASNADGTFTCDGKESFTIHIPTSAETNAPILKQQFGYLPTSAQNCANTILGSDGLEKLFKKELTISADEQTKLSMCIYNSLSSSNKSCANNLAGGEQNLPVFFANVPGEKQMELGNCMNITRYNSLLDIPKKN